MIKNCAWCSDIGETACSLPAIQSSFITLLKMLSMLFFKMLNVVWLLLVNLVGKVMLGKRLASQKHFYLSHILVDQY